MINKALYKFCGKTRKYIFYSVAANCLKLMLAIAFSYSFAYIVNSMVENRQAAIWPFIIVISIAFLKYLLTWLVTKFNNKVISEVKHNLRKAIYEKILEIGFLYKELFTTQEIIHLGVEGVEQLETYYGAYITQLYYALCSSVILFIAVLPINYISALILLIAAPIIPLSLQLIMGIVRKSQKKYWRKYADVGNVFLDNLRGLTTLKIFNADKRRTLDMAKTSEAFRKETMRLLAMQLNSMTIIDWIAYGTSAAVIIMLILNGVNCGTFNLFNVILLVLLSAEFFIPMKTLTNLFHVAMTGVSAGELILDFLNHEVKFYDGQKTFPHKAGIVLKNFSFAYSDGTKALKDINMIFKNNKMTAIVGHSGCGKSTIAAIISGQVHSPHPILFCQQDEYGLAQTPANHIAGFDIQRKEITSNIVRIDHEPHIFKGSVRDNIKMGKPNVSDEDIIKVLKKLQMWDFLQARDGLDTLLISEGKNISGGQMQRIAIARAIISNFKIYIFDEATSNVDVESEDIIISMIRELSKTKTVIYISHKMNTVKLADYIYVLENGQLADAGTHDMLMQNNSIYANLYREEEELISYGKAAVMEAQ